MFYGVDCCIVMNTMKALITGANSLVNKVLLQKLIDMGFDITAHYHSDNDVTNDIKQLHPNVNYVNADFADKESFANFLTQSSSNGKYDVVVTGAVYYAEASDWKAQLDWDEWQKTLAINTISPALLMSHADQLVKDGGVIVNISSTYGQAYMGDMQFTMYGASKAALNLLTENYAKRWHDKNIRVVGIAPGWVRSAWNKEMSEQEVDEMVNAERVVTKLIEPQEIADLMEQLIKNKGVNATTVVIDGGLSSPII